MCPRMTPHVGGPSSNGKFTVKLAYAKIVGTPTTTKELWAKFWKLKVPWRVRILLWTLYLGKILTNRERHERGMTTNPHYHHCSEEVESLDHIFRFCSRTKNLWPHIFDEKVWRLTKDMPFEGWFEWNLKKKDLLGAEGAWQDKFAPCLWWIWRWRNDSVFENKMRLQEEKPRIIRSIREVHSSLSNQNVIHGRNDTCTTKWVRCFPLEHGWIELNIDGCFKEDRNCVAGGGLLRDCHGHWRGGFSVYIGSCSMDEVEMWALIYGIKFEWKRI